MVKDKMHLQESTLFDLDDVAQYPWHNLTFPPAKFDIATSSVKEKMHLQENTLFDLDLWVKVTRYVAKCP